MLKVLLQSQRSYGLGGGLKRRYSYAGKAVRAFSLVLQREQQRLGRTGPEPCAGKAMKKAARVAEGDSRGIIKRHAMRGHLQVQVMCQERRIIARGAGQQHKGSTACGCHGVFRGGGGAGCSFPGGIVRQPGMVPQPRKFGEKHHAVNVARFQQLPRFSQSSNLPHPKESKHATRAECVRDATRRLQHGHGAAQAG